MNTCEHFGCGFGNRSEYCEAWTPQKAAITGACVEMLDDMLIADMPWKGQPYIYKNGITTRAFSYRRVSASLLGGYVPIEENLTVCHQKLPAGGDSYSIRSSWQYIECDEDGYETDYLIEQYVGSDPQLTVWEQDLTTGIMLSRTMTLYDLQTLWGHFNSLFEAIQLDTVNLQHPAA